MFPGGVERAPKNVFLSSFFELHLYIRSTDFGGEIGYVPSLNSQRDLLEEEK